MMDIHVIRFEGWGWTDYPAHQRSFGSLLERNMFFIRHESLIPIDCYSCYQRDMRVIDDEKGAA